MLLILWILWIFVWCLNSGDGFSLEGRGPACEALVCEGGDRETEAFAVVRRWWGAASVSHRRWTDTGRLDLDHVSRWKWRILGLRRGWPGILEWRSLTTSSFGMAKSLTSSFGMTKSNLTSSFAPSGLERHGVEPLSHKSLNARGLENKPAVGWTHVCMCMLSLTMFACTLLFMFCLSCFVHVCGTLFFTCFTCCDMDLTTQVWWLLRLPQLQAKRREWPITRKKRLLRVSVHVVSFLKSRVCACLCMSFACLCMSVFKGCCACHECFWEGFRFSMTSSSLHFDKRTLSSWFWWWLSLTITF